MINNVVCVCKFEIKVRGNYISDARLGRNGALVTPEISILLRSENRLQLLLNLQQFIRTNYILIYYLLW